MDEVTRNLLNACRAALPHFTNPKSLVRHQLESAIAMAENPHTPRRPLADSLQREAEIVGKQLDSASIEQGEPA